MRTIDDIEFWLLRVLWLGVLAMQLWALIDCIGRKAPAFPAAGKLTKATWILLNALALALAYLLPVPTAYFCVILGAVYLADVRPAVREISGPSRW